MSDTLDDADPLDEGLPSFDQASADTTAFQQTAPGVYAPTPAPAPTQALPQQGIPTVGRRRSFAGVSGLDFSGDGEIQAYTGDGGPPAAAPKDTGDKTLWSDYAKNTWNAARGMAASGAGLGDYVLREINGSAPLANWMGKTRDSLNADIQNSIASMSPAAQRALHAQLFANGGVDADGNRIPSPHEVGWMPYLALQATSFIPQTLPFFLPGGVIARAAIAAVQFGAQGAGEAFNTAVDEGRRASETDWMNVPAYAELRRKGTPDTEARQQSLAGAARLMVGAGGALGAATGAAMGPLVGKGVGALGVTSFLGRRALGAAEGALPMGLQAGGDELIHQTLQQELHRGQQTDMGAVARAAGAGALGGGILGGVMGAHRADPDLNAALQHEQENVPTQQSPVTPAATPPTPPPGPAEPTGVPGWSTAPPAPPPTRAPMQPEPALQGPVTTAETTGIPGESPPIGAQRAVAASRARGKPATVTPPTLEQPAPSPTIGQGGLIGPPPVSAGVRGTSPDTAPPAAVVTPGAPAETAPAAPIAPPLVEKSPEPAGTRRNPPAPVQGASKADMLNELQQAHGITMSPRASTADVAARLGRERTRASVEAAPPPAEAEPAPTPEAAPAPTPAEPTIEPAVQHARDLALEQLADARTTVKTVKGTPIDKLVESAWQDLQGRINASNGERADLLNLLKQFVGDRAERAPEDITARTRVAQAMLRRLKNEPLARAPERAVPSESEQALAEVQAEETARGGTEPKAVTGESIGHTARGGGEGESAGQTMGLEPINRPKLSENVTDMEKKARHLAARVVDGELSLEDATKEYGSQNPGKGRKRRADWADFPSALRTLGTKLTDPEQAQRAVVSEMNALEKRFKDKSVKLTDYRREMQRLSSDLDRAMDLTKQERFRRLVAMAHDPVGAAANEAQRERPVEDAPIPEGPSGIDPRSSRYVRMSRDPRISTSYERAFRAHAQYETPLMGHDALGLVANDPLVRTELRPLHEIAKRLQQMLPPDVQVMSIEGALAEGRIPRLRHDDLLRRGVYGAYDPESRTILQNINAVRRSGSHVETLLHEASHAVSWHYLRHLEQTDPYHPDLQALRRIHEELRTHINSEHAAGQLSPAEAQRLPRMLQNIHELHTQMFTDPVVQSFAASRVASPELRAHLAALKLPTPPGASIWRSFANWVRKAVGQPPARSASEFTLLDHIIKPVTDITDRAAEYNKRFLPSDPMLRSAAEPVYDGALTAVAPRARELAERVTDRLDLTGRMSLVRQGVQQFMPTNQIHNVWGKLFERFTKDPAATKPDGPPLMQGNPFDRTIEARQAIARTNKTVRDDPTAGAKTVRALSAALDSGGRKLGEFINAVQENQKGLADPALKARYEALSPADRAAFDGGVKQYGTMYDREVNAELASMFKHTMPEASAAETKAFMDTAKTKASIDAFMSDPDNSRVAQAFGGTGWADNKELLHSLVRFQQDVFNRRENYFPLRRDGNWVVSHGDAGEPDYTVKMFKFRSEAERYRQETRDNNTPNVSQVMKKAEAIGSDLAVNHPATQDLYNRLSSKLGTDAAAVARRELNGILLQRMARQSAFQSKLERQGVKGARTDHGNILNEEFINHANRVGYMTHSAELNDAISDMKRVASWHEHHGERDEGIQARTTAEEMEKRTASIDDYNTPLQAVLGKLNGLSFIKNLLSPSHWFTSTLEAHTMAIPQIGADIGGAAGELRASAMMAQTLSRISLSGMHQIGKGIYRGLKGKDVYDENLNTDIANRLGKGGDKALVSALAHEFDHSGRIDNSYSLDLLRAAKGEGILGGRGSAMAQHVMAISTYGQHVTDGYNKWAIGFTAAKAYLQRKPGDVKGAVKYAMGMVDNSMPDYSPGNKARIGTPRGALRGFGPNAMQFKNYGLFLYSRLGSLVHDIRYGDDKVRAARALAGVLGAHAMTAGAVGLIADPLRYVLGAWDWVSGKAKPHDYQVDQRQFLAHMVGKTWGEYLGAGIVGHGLGIDLQHRVGTMNAVEMPELSAFSEAGYSDLLAKALFGAAGESLASFAGGITKTLQGKPMEGVQDMMPRALRDMMKAYRLTQEGVTAGGKPVLAPSKIPWNEVATQALGFQPAVKEEALMGRHAVQQAEAESAEDRSRIEKRFLAADPAHRADVMHEILQYNQDPAHITKIRMSQLHAQIRGQLRTQQEKFGLKLPRRTAAGLEQAGDFANVPP